MTEAAAGSILDGRPRPRPTTIGWAVLAGVALLGFTGVTSQPVALGPAIALLIVMWVDGLAGLQILGRTTVDVSPLRSVGSPERQPTVLVRASAAGTDRPSVALRPLIRVEPGQPEPVVVDDPDGVVLAYAGDHPVAASSIEYVAVVSYLGLIAVRRESQRRLPGLICRGPAEIANRSDIPHLPAGADVDKIREYVAGDRFSSVNWAATARTTKLHVRQEDPMLDEVVVVLVLASEAGASDAFPLSHATDRIKAALSLARNVMEGVLDDGRSLRLLTVETDGIQEQAAMAAAKAIDRRQPRPDAELHQRIVDRPVADRTELLRRLALAEVSTIVPPVSGSHVRITLDALTVVR